MTLLAMRYRLGGRGEDGTIDCLGVVLAKAAELGLDLPARDPWATVCDQWRRGGLDAATGFPDGWRRLRGEALRDALQLPKDGDVWLLHHDHPGVGIIAGGLFWSATARAGGVVALPPDRVQPRPSEVWRR